MDPKGDLYQNMDPKGDLNQNMDPKGDLYQIMDPKGDLHQNMDPKSDLHAWYLAPVAQWEIISAMHYRAIYQANYHGLVYT